MPLYIVATPIGNLEDITLRAIRILREVDLIACEDTRHTRRLLEKYNIVRPLLSYHEHNERQRATELLERLERGESIALVTDAGSPGISDPAFRIVTAATAGGIPVVPVPGATALVAAVTCSGLPTDSFLFGGFLPPKRAARRARYEAFGTLKATLVFYETPHRIIESLEDALEVLGDREAVIARELTKLHEEFLRGKLSELIETISERPLRGEMTLVIEGAGKDNLEEVQSTTISEQIERLMKGRAMSRNDALKAAARSRGISKKLAYEMLVKERERQDKGES